MSLVILASGGLDSTLMSVLATERSVQVYPVFVDYGQRAARAEWGTCRRVYRKLGLPSPTRVDLAGYGALVPSGLTNPKLRIREDAFLPGRNLLLLVAGAGAACAFNASGVAIGLLREADHLFLDQTSHFLQLARAVIATAHGRDLNIVAPLFEMSKADVVALAADRGVRGTYSCHAGSTAPCGRCISCRELSEARGRRVLKGG